MAWKIEIMGKGNLGAWNALHFTPLARDFCTSMILQTRERVEKCWRIATDLAFSFDKSKPSNANVTHSYLSETKSFPTSHLHHFLEMTIINEVEPDAAPLPLKQLWK